eukprot:7382361-Prymnesium_polylepis.1
MLRAREISNGGSDRAVALNDRALQQVRQEDDVLGRLARVRPQVRQLEQAVEQVLLRQARPAGVVHLDILVPVLLDCRRVLSRLVVRHERVVDLIKRGARASDWWNGAGCAAGSKCQPRDGAVAGLLAGRGRVAAGPAKPCGAGAGRCR